MPVGPSQLPTLDKDLSEDNRLTGQNYFPVEAGNLVDSQLKRDDAFYSDALNYGVGKGGLRADYSSDPMTQALNSGWDNERDTAASGIKTRNDLNAPMKRAENLSTVAKESNAMSQNETQNFNEQYAFQLRRQALYNQWQINKKKAEAAAIGAIFGAIPVIGGGIAASINSED